MPPTDGGALRHLLCLLRHAAQRGKEQGLVDPAVEDRDAHLHALRDHLTPLHVDFVGELGGRQVYGHSLSPPVDYAYGVLSHETDVSMAFVANSDKGSGGRPRRTRQMYRPVASVHLAQVRRARPPLPEQRPPSPTMFAWLRQLLMSPPAPSSSRSWIPSCTRSAPSSVTSIPIS